jgi:prepilin-type N-terminal cleavage/methylation domain-containing protein
MRNPFRRAVGEQSGFTLVELTIAIAVGFVLMVAATSVIGNSVMNSMSNNNHLEAIRNTDVAGAWFIKDFQSALIMPV